MKSLKLSVQFCFIKYQLPYMRLSSLTNPSYGLGLRAPSMVVNGVVIDDLSSAEESLLESLQEQLPKLQRAVYLGNVNDRTNVLGTFIMNRMEE